MDYPVLNRTPDVAQAMVPHSLDGNGNAVPQSLAGPAPVLYLPKLLAVTAAAMTRPADTTAYAAGDAVSNSGTASSVVPISFPNLSDLADAPLGLKECKVATNDTGPGDAGATFEAWFFNSDPSLSSGIQAGDNAAFSQKIAGWLGRMQGTFIRGNDGSIAMLAPVDGAYVSVKPAPGGITLWAVVRTLTAFTPSAASTVLTFTLRGFQGRA